MKKSILQARRLILPLVLGCLVLQPVLAHSLSFSALDVGQGQDNSSASEGYNRPNFFGPPVYTYADVQPRQWLTAAYTDSTTAFASGSSTKYMIDPCRDVFIISSLNPDTFYGKTFTQLVAPGY